MGKIVEKKKKKKGRPSLLDLQKRNLREQQELQQQQKRHQKRNGITNSAPHSRDNYASATNVRRSARRNPNPYDDSPENLAADEDEDDEDDDELAGKRREKKLKLVLRLPPTASLDSAASDSDAGGETAAAENGSRKRKINAISDGSGNKGDKSISGTNQSNAFQGASKLLESGPSTPLPDKKLLLFILDRLQKKDTYGVFSDPVDPEELPDYHEVISHPMDFGTVRKKITGGAYTNLEQFETDVFLICSNAMQYNAPDTIYFRQARSIHELAKKNFENLRQDSDDNEPETKIVRRGRPPTKNLKKQIGRPSLEGAGPEISSDVGLANAGENATCSNHDARKGSHLSDKSGSADLSGRLHGLRNNDVYASWLNDNKFERNDELTGSGLRGNMKHGKKQAVHEESRRNTYTLSHSSAGAREPSVLMTFDGERKQLMPVGVLVEHGYARSLARFAANLGPVAWKVAAQRIERSLPAGVKYGPGWVGENDLPQRKTPIENSPDIVATSSTVNPKVEISSENPRGENFPRKHTPPSSTPVSASHPSTSLPVSATSKSPQDVTPKPETEPEPEPESEQEQEEQEPEPLEGLNSHSGFSVLNSSTVGVNRPRPGFPAHQGPMTHPGMNGFNGFNVAAHMGKLSGVAKPPGFNDPSSQTLEKGFRTNNNNMTHPGTVNKSNPEDTNTKVPENRSTKSARNPLPNRGTEAAVPLGSRPRPSWQVLPPHQKHDPGQSPQQKPDSVPPDLNVRFQSPGSPSSSRVDSTQPDLALQL